MSRVRKGFTAGAVAMLAGALASCTVTVPAGITPVSDFDAERYTGTWYEIARLDFFFERGLDNVTATYELNPDGSVRVINRGYDTTTCRLQAREGRAEFVGSPDVASLAVSFFANFAGGYNVFILDDDYRYAVVAGSDRDYLWILSRTPQMRETTLDRLVAAAATAGFDVSKLVYVDQTGPC